MNASDQRKQDIINSLATAETRGDDATGIVRSLVTSIGLSFNAWFCVCCEIADRNAQAEGFKDQYKRAASKVNWEDTK